MNYFSYSKKIKTCQGGGYIVLRNITESKKQRSMKYGEKENDRP